MGVSNVRRLEDADSAPLACRPLFGGEYIPLRPPVRARTTSSRSPAARRPMSFVAVPRLVAKLTRAGSAPLGAKVWQDTMIELPPEALHTGQMSHREEVTSPVLAANLFSTLPCSSACGRGLKARDYISEPRTATMGRLVDQM